MREFIEFECTTCREKNYTGNKNKKTSTGRLELKKYCRHCRKHTPHKELK
jgi:large subunit ribosomal protein L33